MKEINPNANLDVAAIGGSIATVGVGYQVPALKAVTGSLVNAAKSSVVGSAVGSGSFIAEAIISAVGAPALIIGGLAIVGYALFSD